MPSVRMQSATTAAQSTVWQTRLRNECKLLGMCPPTYQDCSDRRGGRTAWSSIVEINGSKHQARYWYDGSWVNNAREDAAEVALQRMGIVPAPRSPHARLLGAVSAVST